MFGFNFSFIRGLFSASRRVREDQHAQQLAALGQLLSDATRERDAARMAAKTAKEQLTLAREQWELNANERAAAESKLANADSENTRLRRELNAALVRCEQLAAQADKACGEVEDADRATRYYQSEVATLKAGVVAAENVRDRAIEDMNHVQELQREAERKLARAVEMMGKLTDVVNRMVREVVHVRECAVEWSERVEREAAEMLKGIPSLDPTGATERAAAMKFASLL